MNLAAVYPDRDNPTFEMSLEELRAAKRGWTDKDWSLQKKNVLKEVSGNKCKQPVICAGKENRTGQALATKLQEKLVIENEVPPARERVEVMEVYQDVKEVKQKKLKIREIKGETQTGEYFSRVILHNGTV